MLTNKLNGIKKKIYNISFFHIPKTAGTRLANGKKSKIKLIKLGHKFCINDAFRLSSSEKGDQHFDTPYWERYRFIRPKSLRITIIRNPFDLLASYYHHGEKMTEGIEEYTHSGWGSCNFTHKFYSFEDFIRAYCDENFQWHVPLLKQFLFSQIFDGNGKCQVDLIIRYEFMEKALKMINKYYKTNIFDVNYKKWINKTNNKKKNYKEYYTPELIELVKNKCRRELEHFGYTFNGPTSNKCFVIPKNIRYNPYTDELTRV